MPIFRADLQEEVLTTLINPNVVYHYSILD